MCFLHPNRRAYSALLPLDHLYLMEVRMGRQIAQVHDALSNTQSVLWTSCILINGNEIVTLSTEVVNAK